MSGLIKPTDMTFVSKRWGWEQWIVNNELYCGKIIFIRKENWLSYHHHQIKDEVLYIQSGSAWFIWGQDEPPYQHAKMVVGEGFRVEPGLRHQIYAIEDTTVIEFSTQHFDTDSYRTTTELVLSHEELLGTTTSK